MHTKVSTREREREREREIICMTKGLADNNQRRNGEGDFYII